MLPHRHSRSFGDDDGLPYGFDDDGNGGGYPYYANDGDSNSYMFNLDQLAADRADSPSSSSSSLLLQSRQQGRRGGGENPGSKPKYGSDDAVQLAYMEQMYNTIQVLNTELEKERQDHMRLHAASSIDDEIAAALEYPQVSGGGGGHPFAVSDYSDDSSMNLLVESTPSTASGVRRSRPLPSQQPKCPMPLPQNKTLSKDQMDLCATLGKNAELRIRTKEMEKCAEKASEQLDQAQKQMKMVERRISNREEKLRILMKEKLHWQKELKDMRDQVIEEKMRQVELFRHLETAKRDGAAKMEQLDHDLRDVRDENQNLRAQVAEARAHITFQAKKLDDVVRQAHDEKEKLVSCIAETRYKFKEWKEGEAAALRSSREQAVNNVKTEYDLKIARHQEEKQKLREKVKDLEVSLRLMQKGRTLSPLELSLRKATILGNKDNAGTSEAELIEAHSRIRELEALMEHSQEYQKRQENIIKVSEATISRLVQEREVTALENLSAQPLAGGFISPVSSANDTGNNMFSSSIPSYSTASSPNVGAHRDVPKRQSYGNVKSPSSHDNSSSSYGTPRASSSNRIQPASSSPLLDSHYRNETGPAVQPPSLASASASSFSLMTSSPSKLSKVSSAVETTLCHQNETQAGEKLSGSQRQDTGIHVEPKARPELTLLEFIREETDGGRATSLSIDKAEGVDKVQDQPESTTTTTAPPELVVSSKEQFLADEVTRLQRELAELKANAASNKNARLPAPTVSDEAKTSEAPPVESVSTADSVASGGGDIKVVAVDDGTLDGDIIAKETEEALGSDDDGKSRNETITCELKEASADDVQQKEHNDETQQLEQQLPETANAQHPVNVDENKLSGEEKSQLTEEAESKSSAVAEVSEAKDRDTGAPDEDDKESEARAPRVVEALEETVPVAAVNDKKNPTSVSDVTALVVSDTDNRGIELPAQDIPATQENEETSLDLQAEAGALTGSDDAQTTTDQAHEADAPEIMATEDSVSSASLSEVAATQERDESSAPSDVPVVDDLEADSNSVTRETRTDATKSTIDGSEIADVDILVPAKNDVEDGKLEPSKTEDKPAADELKMEIVDATQNAQLDAKGVCDDEKGQVAASVMADECCGDVCSIEAGESEVVDAKLDRDESFEQSTSIEGERDAKGEKNIRQADEEKQESSDGNAHLQPQTGDDDVKPICEKPECEEVKTSPASEGQAAAEEKLSRNSPIDDIEDLKDLAVSVMMNDTDEKADEKATISSIDGGPESAKQPSDNVIDEGSDEKVDDVVADDSDAKAQPEAIVEVVVPVQLTDAKEDSEVAPGEEASEKADVKITHAAAASDTEEEAKTVRDRSPDGASGEDAKEVLTADSEAEVQPEPVVISTTPMQPTNTETESELVLGPEETAEDADDSVPASVQNEHDEVEKVADNLDDAASGEKATEMLSDASEAIAELELVVEAVRPDQVDDIEEDSELSPEPEVSSDAAMSTVVVDQLLDLNKEAVTAQADAVVSVAEKPETDESSTDGGSVSEADCDAVCDPPIARGEEDDGVSVQVEHSGDADNTLFFNNGELCDCETEKEQQQEQQPSPADQQPDQKLSVVGLVASNMVVRVISKGLHHSVVLHLEHRKYVVKTFVLSVLKGAIQSTVTQLMESQGTSQKNLDEKQPEEPGAVEALSIDNGEQENESTGALTDSDPAGASGAAQSSLAEQSEAVENKPSAQADKLDVKPAENDVPDVQLDSPVPASESIPITDEEAPASTENATVVQTEESTDVVREPPRYGGEDRTFDRQVQPSVMSQKQIEPTTLVDVPASTVEKQLIQTQSEDRDKGEGLEAPTCPSEQQQISREKAVAAETATGEGANVAIPITDPDDRGSLADDEDGDDATAFCSLRVSTFTKHFVLAVQHEAVASMLSSLCPQERIEELQEPVVDDRKVPKADLTAENTLRSSIAVAETPSAFSILEPGLSMEETATLDQSPDHRVNPGDTDCEVSPPADILVITHDVENTEQSAEGDTVDSSLPDPPDSPAAQPDSSAVEFVAAVQEEAIAAVMKKSMGHSSTLESCDETVTTPEHGGEVTDRCRMEEAPETVKEDGGIVSGVPYESPVLANLELIPTDKSPVDACDVTSDAEFELSEGISTSTSECCEQRGSEAVKPCEPTQAVDTLEREVVEAVDEICHTVSDGKLESTRKLLESASALSADTVRDDEEVSTKFVILATEQPEVCEKDDEKLDTDLVVIEPTPVAAEAEVCLVAAVAHVSRQISLDATTAALEAYSAAYTSDAASVAVNHAASGGGAVDPVLDVSSLVKCESISPGDDSDKVESPETPAVDTGAEREVEPTEARTLSADSDHVSELYHASSDFQSEESRLLPVNAIPNYTSVGLLDSPHEEICNDESAIHEALEGVAVRLAVVLKSCASTMNDVFGTDASTISARAKVSDDPPAEESDAKTIDDALDACSQTLSEAVAEFPASDNGETVSDAGPQIPVIEGGADLSPDADAGKPDSSSVEPDGQLQDLLSETVETAVMVNEASGEVNRAPALDAVLNGPPQEIANAVGPNRKDDTGIPETVPTAAATTVTTDAVNEVIISLNPTERATDNLTDAVVARW